MGRNLRPTRNAPYPIPGHVLGAAATACGPRTRAASAPGRQEAPVRGRGRGASPGAGRGHRPPNPAAQGPSWTPRTTPSPTQLLTGPRGRTGANNAPPGSSDRAAGLTKKCYWARSPHSPIAFLLLALRRSLSPVLLSLATPCYLLPDGCTWGQV